MRTLAECRVARETDSLRDALVAQRRPGRRTGAIMVVNDAGELTGIFTDSDLARLLEAKRDEAINGPIANVMTRQPSRVVSDSPLPTAFDMLVARNISELPVVDDQQRPVGLIDITDIVGIVREEGDVAPADPGPAVLKLVAPPAKKPRRRKRRS
jgi:arabinose-5-phosphate isomerase